MNIHELETDKEKISYDRIRVLMEKINSDYNKMGREVFVGSYQTRLGFYMKTWQSVEKRILLAYLENVNPDFHYSGNVTAGKVIVLDERRLDEILEGGQEALDRQAAGTPAAFLKYGLIR